MPSVQMPLPLLHTSPPTTAGLSAVRTPPLPLQLEHSAACVYLYVMTLHVAPRNIGILPWLRRSSQGGQGEAHIGMGF